MAIEEYFKKDMYLINRRKFFTNKTETIITSPFSDMIIIRDYKFRSDKCKSNFLHSETKEFQESVIKEVDGKYYGIEKINSTIAVNYMNKEESVNSMNEEESNVKVEWLFNFKSGDKSRTEFKCNHNNKEELFNHFVNQLKKDRKKLCIEIFHSFINGYENLNINQFKEVVNNIFDYDLTEYQLKRLYLFVSNYDNDFQELLYSFNSSYYTPINKLHLNSFRNGNVNGYKRLLTVIEVINRLTEDENDLIDLNYLY